MTPGLGVVMIVMIAAEYGWRRTLPACLGTALGITLLFSVGMSGVGVVVASSPLLFAAIKIAGALFLLWLGVHNWRKPPLQVVENKKSPTQHHDGLFSKCFLLSVTNPQPIIFCVSIFPQFIDAEIAYVPQVTLMIAVYTLMCLCLHGLLCVDCRPRSHFLSSRSRPPTFDACERHDLYFDGLGCAVCHHQQADRWITQSDE